MAQVIGHVRHGLLGGAVERELILPGGDAVAVVFIPPKVLIRKPVSSITDHAAIDFNAAAGSYIRGSCGHESSATMRLQDDLPVETVSGLPFPYIIYNYGDNIH